MKASALRMMSVDDGVVRLGPQTVHLDVTNACNTDCVTCWDHSPLLDEARPSSWKRQRADVDELARVLDDVQSLGGLEAVIVSGMGEPFTHPRIYDLLRDIKRRGLHLTIITNLVAADAVAVAAIGVDALLVGMHGASVESYLAFHPSFTRAHWDKANAQLALLSSSDVDVKLVQVICRHNAHELVAMVEQAASSSAAQVNFKLASLKHGTEAAGIDDAQRATLLARDIAAAEERAAALDVVTNLDVLRRQVEVGGELTAPIDEVGCFIGYSYARITVDGTVLYCCNTDVEVGSLRDAPFSTWWTSPSWERWRRRMRDGDYLASCFQCGKLNQNEKLSRRFRESYGDERWLAVTGRGPFRRAAPPPPSSSSSSSSLPSSSSQSSQSSQSSRLLRVLP